MKPHDEVVSEELFEWVRAQYAYPLLRHRPRLVQIPPNGMNTASFNLADQQCLIAVSLLDELAQCGLDRGAALRGILVHEIGHYVCFPRELQVLIYLLQYVEKAQPPAASAAQHSLIVDAYCDVVNNLNALCRPGLAESLAGLYRTMAAQKGHPLNQLLIALYQKLSGVDLGQDPDAVERERLTALCGIQYQVSSTPAHAANAVSFGEIIVPLLPVSSSDPSLLDGYGSEQMNDALDAAIQRFGRESFRRMRDYLQRRVPHFKDPSDFAEAPPEPMAGTAGARDVEWNSEQISYYARLAATAGVHIAARPLREDASDTYPGEQVTFEVGDPLHRLNPWSSPTLIPGITQRWREEQGQRVSWRVRTPDLLILLDSSASMPHPRDLSPAVLAAFILARNYAANGAKVGVMNFSTHMLFVRPSRNLSRVWQGLCAWWGGGTVLDVAKIRDWLLRLRDEKLAEIEFSSEADYRALLERLDLDEEMFQQKRLEVPLRNVKISRVFEQLDTILITDGAIMNINEVVTHIQRFGQRARTFVFLINNPADLQHWRELNLPNTRIFEVSDAEDLPAMILNRVREMARETRWVKGLNA